DSSVTGVQTCALTILNHSTTHTFLCCTKLHWSYKHENYFQADFLFSVMYFQSTLRASFTSVSIVAPQGGHLNVFQEPKFLFISRSEERRVGKDFFFDV